MIVTYEFADVTAWAAWAAWYSNDDVQRVLTKLRTLATDVTLELCGPSPIVPQPIQPGSKSLRPAASATCTFRIGLNRLVYCDGGIMPTGNQPLAPPAAQFYRQVIGDVELIALSDGGINYPAAMIFGNVPPEGATRYDLPGRQLFLPYTLLLIRRGRSLTLCDVGAGDLGNPGDRAFPGLDHRTSRTNLLVSSLLAAGIDPGEIDIVLITHAHPDHVGGMIDAEGRLVFPSAHLCRAKGVGLLDVGRPCSGRRRCIAPSSRATDHNSPKRPHCDCRACHTRTRRRRSRSGHSL